MDDQRGRGVYATLLGEPYTLYSDSEKRPEAYSDEARVLLRELVDTGRAPKPEEHGLLDHAFLTFYEASDRKAKRPASKMRKTASVEPTPLVETETAWEPFSWG